MTKYRVTSDEGLHIAWARVHNKGDVIDGSIYDEHAQVNDWAGKVEKISETEAKKATSAPKTEESK